MVQKPAKVIPRASTIADANKKTSIMNVSNSFQKRQKYLQYLLPR